MRCRPTKAFRKKTAATARELGQALKTWETKVKGLNHADRKGRLQLDSNYRTLVDSKAAVNAGIEDLEEIQAKENQAFDEQFDERWEKIDQETAEKVKKAKITKRDMAGARIDAIMTNQKAKLKTKVGNSGWGVMRSASGKVGRLVDETISEHQRTKSIKALQDEKKYETMPSYYRRELAEKAIRDNRSVAQTTSDFDDALAKQRSPDKSAWAPKLGLTAKSKERFKNGSRERYDGHEVCLASELFPRLLEGTCLNLERRQR